MQLPELSPEQKQSLNDSLERGTAFEELINMKGWKILQANYEARVKALVNGLLLSDEPITVFESERQQLKGIRSQLSQITSDLDTLKHDRERRNNSSK